MNDEIKKDMGHGKENIKDGWQDMKNGAENLGEHAKKGAQELGRDIRKDI